jgi:phage FluMu gp28-like protein
VPFLIEMANAPTRQQEQILWALLDALKEGFPGRWSFAGDATGPGQTLMEYTGDRYGRAELDTETGRYIGGPIHEVTLSRPWYGEWMPKYIALFEDGFLSLPGTRPWRTTTARWSTSTASRWCRVWSARTCRIRSWCATATARSPAC